MKRAAAILCLVIVACGVFWMFPLFRVVRLDEMRAAEQRSAFNAQTFVARFWQDRFLPSLDAAADAKTVLTAMDDDRQAALNKFGRKSGVGRTTLLVIQGIGSIVNVDAKSVGVSLTGDKTKIDVVLRAGLLFGNSVRDATGLLDSSDFENSQQYNDISAELNRHIELRVIPILKREAVVGRQVQFVGCADVPDKADTVRPLTLIPLVVSIN
jgi:predicted lipoprotein